MTSHAFFKTVALSHFGFSIRHDIFVSVPTNQLGGLLDVAATRRDLAAPDVKVVDVGLSDHYLLQWSVSSSRLTPVTETVVRRPWRSLDIADFRSALSSSVLCQPNCWLGLDADAMASFYDTELTVMLDRAVPARTVTRRPRPSDPWFDAECRAAKRLTRRLERAAIATAKKPDAAVAANANQVWQTQRRSYRVLRNQKRDAFWSDTVAANQSSPRLLWRSIDLLLGRGRTLASDAISVDEFHRFFTDKVEAVRAATAGGLPPTFTASSVASSFTGFHKVSVDDVISAICRLPDKSCVADTLPTPQLKLVADLIAPFLTELFNCSLSTATVPTVFKSAVIAPLIKKPDLDSTDPRSYRPISNISVVSKLLERIVFRQLYSYLSAADLVPRLQSA